MSTKLLPYQNEGVRLLNRFRGRALLADEMGLGKTIQVLTFIKQHPNLRPAVIVVPAFLKYEWQEQAIGHRNLPTTICEGQMAPDYRSQILDECNDTNRRQSKAIYIINYDVLNFWTRYLKHQNPKLLVFDECHYIKNTRAKRTKAVERLGKICKYTIAIGGTPLLAKPSELFTTLRILWPEKFGDWYEFGFRYCDLKMNPFGGWDSSGSSRLPELRAKLRRYGMIRRTKVQVAKDLPPKQRYIVTLDINNRKDYRAAKDDIVSWLKNFDTEKAIRAARAESLVKLGYLQRLTTKGKMPEIAAWIDNFLESSNEKVVIFFNHTTYLRQIYERYKTISVVADGDVSIKGRKLAEKQFKEDRKRRIFLGQIDAAGIGITLTKARTVVFAEMNWTPSKLIQAEDRCHRIGQNRRVMTYYLIARDTVESELARVVKRKQDVVTSVLDGKGKLKDLELDIMSLFGLTSPKTTLNGKKR